MGVGGGERKYRLQLINRGSYAHVVLAFPVVECYRE